MSSVGGGTFGIVGGGVFGVVGPSAPAFSPTDIDGLRTWLDSDAIVGTVGDPVALWPDVSGAGADAVPGSAIRPTLVTAGPNGHQAVRFTGGRYLEVASSAFAGATSVEVFMVIKVDFDPSVGKNGGLWLFGSATQAAHYPFFDGNIYDSFASTLRKATGNPSLSLATWRAYNVTSAPGEWTSRIDGVQHYTTATNTVSLPSTFPFLIGRSYLADEVLAGEIATILVYDHKLSTQDRSDLNAWAASKYGLSFA